MNIGLHVSIAGGVYNAPLNAANLNCETFQIFTRSPQGGPAPKLTDRIVRQFNQNCKKYGFKNYYVHTPYFINYASNNNRIRFGSISIVREELERASKLGAKALMTHLGSGKDFDKNTARKKVVEGLLKTLDSYQSQTQFLIELAAGAGLILGADFQEIAYYIKQVENKDKRLKGKLGVCFDTCHAWAVGYDLHNKKSVELTFKKFDQAIGLKRLGLIHINDSKTEFNSHRDRHEHIGQGKIGLDGFKALVKHPKLKNVDLVLETPHDGQEKSDLETLKKLRNK